MSNILNQRKIIVVIIFIFIIVAFPTSHTRQTEEKLVKTLDCTRILQNGDSITEIWKLNGRYKIITRISSSQEIQVFFHGTGGGEYKYKGEPKKIYETQEITSLNTWNATVLNPIGSGGGTAAKMSGLIKVYQIEKKVWLPWWMP
jgi:hypothetical protein